MRALGVVEADPVIGDPFYLEAGGDFMQINGNPLCIGLFESRIIRPVGTGSVSYRACCRRCPCWGGRCSKSIAILLRNLAPPECYERQGFKAILNEQCDCNA